MLVPAVEEVSNLLGVSRPTAIALLSRGTIRALRVGKLWRARREDIHAYVNLQIGDPPGTPVTVLLGTKEVAAVLNVSDDTVLRLFESRRLRAFQIDNKLWRTKCEIVMAWIKENLPPAGPTFRDIRPQRLVAA